MSKIVNGVYPTTITPFRDNKIDYQAVEQILDYYINSGCQGVFAVCQSSEMFDLSFDERIELAKYIVNYVGNKLVVVASGHISNSLEDQVKEINAIWNTGVDAVVLVSNRLDQNNISDEEFIKNGNTLLSLIDSNITLGIYECPYPYKRLLSKDIIDWMIKTNRFAFIKDTCCDINVINARLTQLKGSGIGLFNANGQTLYDSLKLGAAGYSGIMANFICEPIVWLVNNYKLEEAKKLGTDFAFYSFIENQSYPASGKYALQLKGIDILLDSRKDCEKFFNKYTKDLIDKLLNAFKNK